jgi:hypothetical protein
MLYCLWLRIKPRVALKQIWFRIKPGVAFKLGDLEIFEDETESFWESNTFLPQSSTYFSSISSNT